MIIALCLAGALGAAGVSPKPLIPESDERDQFTFDVRTMFQKGQYAELEALARDLVAKDPRYSCGVSKLVDLYQVFWPGAPGGSVGPDAITASLQAWAKQSPGSYLPLAGLATVEQWRANDARGPGFAGEVAPSQWKGFEAHMARANEYAQRALALKPNDPQFYAALIGFCRDLSCPRSQVDGYLAKALAINPRFDAVYVDVANYLLPLYHGTPQEFAAFASQASAANKALGEIVYARVGSTAVMIEGSATPQAIPGLRWERIQAGLREIDRRYPDSARTYHLMALSAYVYQNRPAAIAAFKRLGTERTKDIVKYWRTDETFRGARVWAVGRYVPSPPPK